MSSTTNPSIVVARIRDNATGAVAEDTYEVADDIDDDGVVYYWTAGNLGCDCNRSGYFDTEDDECGRTRFSLVGLTRGGRELDWQWDEQNQR